MKGMNMMYDYRGKIAGMIIAAVGIILLIVQKITGFTVLEKFNADQHFNMILWFTLLGLFTMMFSKEKMEDERVQFIRMKSLLYAFVLMIAATLAFGLTVSIMPFEDMDLKDGTTLTPDDIIMGGRMLMFYPAVAMVIYLVMFHVGLYFDNTWDYEDKPWSFSSLKKHWGYRIAIIIAGIAIIELIFKLFE
jgi:hypothetical protein